MYRAVAVGGGGRSSVGSSFSQPFAASGKPFEGQEHSSMKKDGDCPKVRRRKDLIRFVCDLKLVRFWYWEPGSPKVYQSSFSSRASRTGRSRYAWERDDLSRVRRFCGCAVMKLAAPDRPSSVLVN
jgi:hypothetical protein